MNFDYNKHIAYMTLAGSRAYGTNTPESDYDYRGVIIAPTAVDDGFLHSFEQKEGLDGGYTDSDGVFREFGKDSVAYEIRKFFKLAGKCNPNIIEILFAPDDLVVVNSEYGEALRAARHDFLSKMARDSFHGYAYAQLKRIKLHKVYWDREKAGDVPPKPERADYGLPHRPKYPKDKLNSLIAVPASAIAEEERSYIESERRYFEDKAKYDKWNQWAKSRNPSRAELERKFGYDTKHAMHLVRLLCMCEEILRDKDVLVRRPDAPFLMEIRNGKMSYEELMDWVEKKEDRLRELEKASDLPNKPNWNKLEDLCVELVRKARRENFGL